MDRISMEHGAGGKMSHELFEQVFSSRYGNKYLDRASDKAVLKIGRNRVAFTSDSFVMSPRQVPGCSLGALSVFGTVNDLLTCGAKPLYLSSSFVIEEGFLFDELNQIASDMAFAAKKCKVEIVTGDTKVVERGKADGVYIVTSGIGAVIQGVGVSGSNARVRDRVIVTGSVGNHGVAVMIARGEFGLSADIRSDCGSLSDLVLPLLRKFGSKVHVLRDPTRGGLATVLNEISVESRVAIEINEGSIPIEPSVRAACDLLGMDPLYMACEGAMVLIVDKRIENPVLRELRRRGAPKATTIGAVAGSPKGKVMMTTSIGGKRYLSVLKGMSLPRIC
jgi:hydrogenase expression/formation protein HypE